MSVEEGRCLYINDCMQVEVNGASGSLVTTASVSRSHCETFSLPGYYVHSRFWRRRSAAFDTQDSLSHNVHPIVLMLLLHYPCANNFAQLMEHSETPQRPPEFSLSHLQAYSGA